MSRAGEPPPASLRIDGIPILFIAGMFVFINLLTDLLYAVVDPRISFE